MADPNKPSGDVDDFLVRLTPEQREQLRKLDAGETDDYVEFDIEAEEKKLRERIRKTTEG